LASETATADRIAAAFRGHGRRAALMPYLMGGFPSVDESLEIGLACADAGADLLELGVPFSDPLADGPVIHAAATTALSSGADVHQVLEVCERLGRELPVVLMVYANAVLAAGAERFAARAAAAGADGLIVPDLPHDEAGAVRAACDRAGVALVPLVAPTSSPDRIAAIAADARGFVYTVAVAGTTGERSGVATELGPTIERVRSATDLPVAAGFGIASPDDARAVAELADGVIVGSRLVRAAGDGGAPAVHAAVAELAHSLEGA
jgi:tryptophan synthase alpha chain